MKLAKSGLPFCKPAGKRDNTSASAPLAYSGMCEASLRQQPVLWAINA